MRANVVPLALWPFQSLRRADNAREPVSICREDDDDEAASKCPPFGELGIDDDVERGAWIDPPAAVTAALGPAVDDPDPSSRRPSRHAARDLRIPVLIGEDLTEESLAQLRILRGRNLDGGVLAAGSGQALHELLVSLYYGERGPVQHDPPSFEPYRTLAELDDLLHAVRNQQ